MGSLGHERRPLFLADLCADRLPCAHTLSRFNLAATLWERHCHSQLRCRARKTQAGGVPCPEQSQRLRSCRAWAAPPRHAACRPGVPGVLPPEPHPDPPGTSGTCAQMTPPWCGGPQPPSWGSSPRCWSWTTSRARSSPCSPTWLLTSRWVWCPPLRRAGPASEGARR